MQKVAKEEKELSLAVQEQNRQEAQLETWLSEGDKRAIDAVKKQREVSQEMFEEEVRENIEDFDVSIEEAIKDAKAQFEIQGLLCNQVDDKECFKKLAK